MNVTASNLGPHDLVRAAQEVRQLASTASAADIPGALGEIERALSELSSACYTLGPAVTRTLANEQQEPGLSILHHLGAVIGGAARTCRYANGALAPLVVEAREREPVSAPLQRASAHCDPFQTGLARPRIGRWRT